MLQPALCWQVDMHIQIAHCNHAYFKCMLCCMLVAACLPTCLSAACPPVLSGQL
jgi:hypothetical protein